MRREVTFPTMNRDLEEEDLPLVAVFYSDKLKHARVRIDSVQEQVGFGGRMERKAGTGFDVLFRVHRAYVRNSKVLALMMKHPMFRHTSGWDIDEEDPTGFWRAMGIVKEIQVVETRLNLEATEKPELPNLAGIKSKVRAWEKATKVEEVDDGGDSTDSPGVDGAPRVNEPSTA